MYEVFEHTADVGLRIQAENVSQLFADAGRGLFSLLVANLDGVRPIEARSVRLPAGSYDYLLFDWLTELLYLFESQRLVLSDFRVEVTEDGLVAEVRGEQLDLERHRAEHEVKAITYHGLRCEPTTKGWLAEVIVDI